MSLDRSNSPEDDSDGEGRIFPLQSELTHDWQRINCLIAIDIYWGQAEDMPVQ